MTGFANMPACRGYLLKGVYDAAPLSAISVGQESSPVSFEDGLFLPSSCHGKTWILDNFQGTCGETSSCQMSNSGRDLCTEGRRLQSACRPTAAQGSGCSSMSCERTTRQSGNSVEVLESISQSYQSGSCPPRGFAGQSCQPLISMAKGGPSKTHMSESYQSMECESTKCQSQSSTSSSCRPLVRGAPGSRLLESSSTYQKSCCVTGGL
ncbi:PREDICTED: keratin-associated protein 27-1 [Condylura cristata]|uniref:keratin-associated protein 27-1 n=1 Tax=Condylura cristata TaxID=143302 RepID=UPI0003343D9B|nr:PREDICTED: keratin-associated protein 27-1 [Condylura cristata]